MWWVILLFFYVFYFFYFYRKPTLLKKNSFTSFEVFSPSFGTIQEIFYRPDDTLFLSCFLSPLDIHYQYIPMNGILTNQIYDHTGKYYLAYEGNKSNQNEKMIHTLETIYGKIYIYQIAGYVTRRIKSFLSPFSRVYTGEPLGVIELGSRVDLILPNASRFVLQVKKGDRVFGPTTKIGYYLDF